MKGIPGIPLVALAIVLSLSPSSAQEGENRGRKLLPPLLEDGVPRIKPLPPLPVGDPTAKRPEVPAPQAVMPREVQPPVPANPIPVIPPLPVEPEMRPGPPLPGIPEVIRPVLKSPEPSRRPEVPAAPRPKLDRPLSGLPLEVKRPRPTPNNTPETRIPTKEKIAPVIPVPSTPGITSPGKPEMTEQIPTVPRAAEVLPEDMKKELAESERVNRARIEASTRANPETTRLLQDRGRRESDRGDARPRKIENENDARDVILSVLGGTIGGGLEPRERRDGAGPYPRLSPEQVGRDPRDRKLSVDFLSRRFRGRAEWNEAPPSWRHEHRQTHRDPYYFGGNRRVVYYHSYQSIPPVLLASHHLHSLQVTTVSESPYRVTPAAPHYDRNLPEAYRQEGAYAVSYAVDPDSAVVLDDILFAQGSTNFADAYSYDLVVDLAEAMNASDVAVERFVVEGHASAEGNYNANLALSQSRAERIARDLVSMGVAPERLVPVGYGETEARYAENSPEDQRGLDRRVMVFRLTE